MELQQQVIDYNDEANKIEPSDESSVQINVPFDPTFIRIRRDPFTLGELIDKIEHNEINFITKFQRKADLWDPIKQSRLIESILLKLPLPAFYFAENDAEKTNDNIYVWQVIDGLQRCSVFKSFVVDKSMQLEKLEFLSQFNEYHYDNLPREMQRRLSQTPITVFVVEKGTPEAVKFNIFKRINTGGLILTPQEIRHALNQGIASDFIADLADIQSFKDATCGIIDSERMEDRDFVTRFVSFYITPYANYEPDLDTFMTKGMELIKTLSDEKRAAIKNAFERSMHIAIQIFGNDAFRKRRNNDDKRSPINKALFEIISVTFAKMNEPEIRTLLSHAATFRNKFVALNNNDAFLKSIGGGTGEKHRVVKRFSEIERIIHETISN